MIDVAIDKGLIDRRRKHGRNRGGGRIELRRGMPGLFDRIGDHSGPVGAICLTKSATGITPVFPARLVMSSSARATWARFCVVTPAAAMGGLFAV